MDNSLYKYTTWAVMAILLILGFSISNYCSNKRDEQIFLDKNYNGTVQDIYFFEDNRGFPSLQIKGEWHHFGGRETTIEDIQIGDSVIKRKKSDTIYVFKHANENVWLKYTYHWSATSNKFTHVISK